jgi:hypothetical protein
MKLSEELRAYFHGASGMPAGKPPPVPTRLLDPDWANAVQEGAWQDRGDDTVFGAEMKRRLAAIGGKALRSSRRVFTTKRPAEGPHRENAATIVLTDGLNDYHVPAVRVGAKWYFARKPVKTVPAGTTVTAGKAAEKEE